MNVNAQAGAVPLQAQSPTAHGSSCLVERAKIQRAAAIVSQHPACDGRGQEAQEVYVLTEFDRHFASGAARHCKRRRWRRSALPSVAVCARRCFQARRVACVGPVPSWLLPLRERAGQEASSLNAAGGNTELAARRPG